MKIFSLILMAALTAVDQLIKMLVVTHLRPIGDVEVIPGLLHLTYVENTGASFGMLPDLTWVFAAMSLIVSALIVVLFLKFKTHNFFSYFAAITIVAGGIGNLIDRVIFGYVVDYIHFKFDFFPYIFNFADIMVVAGVISFIIFYIKNGSKIKGFSIVEEEKENGNEV